MDQKSPMEAEPSTSERGVHTPPGIFDINGVNFNKDLFVKKIMKEYSVTKLIDTESNLEVQIKDLDSDMQTLVYENYNKFILATDTIRKMKTDFRGMEEKMELLSTNIGSINVNCSKISSSLQEKRQKVRQFAAVKDIFDRLNFLLHMPEKLKQYCDEGNFEEAVSCYLSGMKSIDEFTGVQCLEKIKEDCVVLANSIRNALLDDFMDREKSSQDLTRNVTLLLSLGEDEIILGHKFLDNARPKLAENLESTSIANSPNVPLEEFMELGCGVFLSNLSLVIASFSQGFILPSEVQDDSKTELQRMLSEFSADLMHKFMTLMEDRLTGEIKRANPKDSESRDETLRALDRLYRRLTAMGTLMPNTDFAPTGLDLIHQITKLDACLSLERIKCSFEEAVKQSSSDLRFHPGGSQETLGSILATFAVQMKSSVNMLRDFCRPDLHFAQNLEFRRRVVLQSVREGLIVAAFQYLINFGREIVKNPSYDSITWLLLSKLYFDIEMTTVEFMINNVEEDFDIGRTKNRPNSGLTNASVLKIKLKETATFLVQEFVALEGSQFTLLMRSAIFEEDTFNTPNAPCGPRPQMKKVIEMLSKLEKQVDPIFPDPDTSYMKSERSSDSSRRSVSTLGGNRHRPPMWSGMDPNMVTNINKLFSEKIEIFSPVETQKSDILMCVVKIGLRAMLEFVRMKSFNQNSLQQIQVDLYFFQQYLWKYVNNESILCNLLEEVLTSANQRCLHPPVLLEPSVVESLAEK